MKRRVWTTSILFYGMAFFMLLMAIASYRQNTVLFLVELTVAVLCTAAVIIADLGFHEHITRTLRIADRVFGRRQKEVLEEFPMPIVIVGAENDIVWVNTAFTKLISGEDCQGENVLRYLFPHTLHQILQEKGADVEIGERKFTVYSMPEEDGAILYYVENTYYKQIEREYAEKHPVVLSVAFDNRDELLRDATGGEDAMLTSEVEKILREWANTALGGFFRRLSNNRYLIMTDEAHVAKAAAARFEVLDQVRKIRNAQNLSATVSIGVGRGAPGLSESEQWAQQALNMALGRGGDQVAVKQEGESYEFFGGLSKGVEKRDKVRTRVIAAALSDHIQASGRVYIMGHRYSDLDSVGSALGLWAAITKGLKQQAFVVVNRQESLAKELIDQMETAYPDQKIFMTPQDAMMSATPKTLLIVTDCHSTSVIESTDVLDAVSRVIVIDHHRMMVNYIKNTLIFYHEPYASSASEMVAELVQYMSSTAIGKWEAQAMLAGIMLDTKNYVLRTGVRTFEASAFLRRRGADTVMVKKLFADSIDTYKMKSHLIMDAQTYRGCAISCADTGAGNMRIAAAQAADELLSIQGVKASFVLYRVGSNDVNFSARSFGEVNVQVLMEALGGGGHMTMAGAYLQGVTLAQAQERLQTVLDEKLEQATAGNT